MSEAEDQIYAALDTEILKRQGLEDELKECRARLETWQQGRNRVGTDHLLNKKDAELDQAYERMEELWEITDYDHLYFTRNMLEWFNEDGKAKRGVR